MATKNTSKCAFQMPLHYPRYKKNDYEQMPEPTLDLLLNQYGLNVTGDVDQKRKFAMSSFLWPSTTDDDNRQKTLKSENNNKKCYFQIPLHYPRYKKKDYEQMSESTLDCLLGQYGLPVIGDVDQKRSFAMGVFLWPSQAN